MDTRAQTGQLKKTAMISTDDLSSPSCPCVHFLAVSKINAVLARLPDTKSAVFRVSVTDIQDERQLLARIAVAMRFPSYFGENWDAFEECIRDMEWFPATGYVLVLDDSSALWRNTPQWGGKLIESWLFAAQEWARANTAFHLAFVL